MAKEKTIVMKCCICGREKTEQGWQYRDQSDEAARIYSHGFCSACYENEIMKMRFQTALVAAPAYR
jgi:hypothetical protein